VLELWRERDVFTILSVKGANLTLTGVNEVNSDTGLAKVDQALSNHEMPETLPSLHTLAGHDDVMSLATYGT